MNTVLLDIKARRGNLSLTTRSRLATHIYPNVSHPARFFEKPFRLLFDRVKVFEDLRIQFPADRWLRDGQLGSTRRFAVTISTAYVLLRLDSAPGEARCLRKAVIGSARWIEENEQRLLRLC